MNSAKIIKELRKIHQIANKNDQKVYDKYVSLKSKLEELGPKKKTAWEYVELARHSDRPKTQEYINIIFDDFIELHGDRLFKDDSAIIGGIGTIGEQSFTIIGNQKGLNTKDNIKRNFGMASPEGYRKGVRLIEQAEKFNRPIITFIDTPGAYPGIGAEERGQGEAIAKSMFKLSNVSVPVLAFIIGEGGSGGALALGVADKVFMLENSIYSILSPEGYASILWKDGKKMKEAAECMKLTSFDILELNIIDGIISEPIDGAQTYPYYAARNIKDVILDSIGPLKELSEDDIKEQRYKKFRKMGQFDRYVK